MQNSKIIHIITGLNVGGAEQMLKRLLLSDPNSKKNALIISLTGVGTIGAHLRELGYNVKALDFRKPSVVLRNFWILYKTIRKSKPRIVQTWMYHADFFGGLAARMAGCRNVVWGIRNTFVPRGSRQTYWLMRGSALLSHVIPKKIVCVAETAKKAHIAYGYNAKKMIVIPNGFDFSNFDPQIIDPTHVRHELNISSSDFIVGCIGRWHADKGQDILIMAIALLDKIKDKRIRFMLVGRGCDNSNVELIEQLHTLGLTPLFLLLGERYDIPECLMAMDVFCMPSRTEGFPNGLGEAMAMGLPCVATLAGDAKSLAGDTAVLVAANDPMALAAGLTKMICMAPEQRQFMGKQAANRVRNQFSIDKARERFYEVYREVMGISR